MGGSRKKIIIAEDDTAEQEFIKAGFERSGVFDIVTIVPNGHKLVGTLESLSEKELPDVILSDINMPLMNGYEALVKVKKNPALSEIPFVIFSTSKEENTKNTSLQLGAKNFMIKPENLDDYENFAKELYALTGIK